MSLMKYHEILKQFKASKTRIAKIYKRWHMNVGIFSKKCIVLQLNVLWRKKMIRNE